MKMIVEKTERLICKTEMKIINGKPVENLERRGSLTNLLELKPSTGMEYGFVFYDPESEECVCHIHFEKKRRNYEISYGTKEKYRNQGYMKEALKFFVDWIFSNTSIEALYALINDNTISEKILLTTGFEYEKNDEYGKWYNLKKQ